MDVNAAQKELVHITYDHNEGWESHTPHVAPTEKKPFTQTSLG